MSDDAPRVVPAVATEPAPEPATEPVPEAAPVNLVEPRGNPWLAMALSWLVPGLGHAYLGRWRRGLAFALLVGMLIFVGLTLRGPLWGVEVAVPGQPGVSLPVNSQIFSLPLVAAGLSGYEGVVSYQGYEYGMTFLLTASLFSLLLILDAWDLSRGYKP